MGLKHLFRSKKSKKDKQKNDPFGEGQQVFVNPLYVSKSDEEDLGDREPMESAPETKSDEMEISQPTNAQHNAFLSSISGKDELFQLSDILAKSKKGGLGKNSEKYEAVHRLLLQIQAAQITESFGNDNANKDVQTLTDMLNLYGELLGACDAYNARKSHTDAGKARQAIVATIKAVAERDAKGMSKALDEVPVASKQQRKAMTWKNLNKISRMDNYVVPSMEVAEGGQASDVFKFKNPDPSGSKLLFFKPESVVDTGDNPATWVMANFLAAHPDGFTIDISKYIKTSFMDEAGNVHIQLENGRKNLGFELVKEEYQAEFIKCQEKASVLAKDVLSPMGLTNTGKQDMAGRNVATSRVADLLGVGNLIARSRFATVQGADGKSRQGIVMEGAEGEDGKKLINTMKERNGQSYVPNKDEHQTAARGVRNRDLDKFAGKNDIFQPTFLRDMSSLQVLDAICGQVDRHSGNMFMKVDANGNLVGVTGIDNDAAFGRTEGAASATDNGAEKHDREVADNDGNLIIPHMDKALAVRIMALEPSVLSFTLSDILDGEAIAAAQRRLVKIQKAISNAKEGQIVSEEDWGTEAVRNDMMFGVESESKAALSDEYGVYNFGENLKEKFGTVNRDDVSWHQRRSFDKMKKKNAKKKAAMAVSMRSQTTYMDRFNLAYAQNQKDSDFDD